MSTNFEAPLRAIFEEACEFPHREVNIKVVETPGGTEVRVWTMYDAIPINFHIMMKLAEVFETKDFDVDGWSCAGCETCDWGSEYGHEFFIPKGKAT